MLLGNIADVFAGFGGGCRQSIDFNAARGGIDKTQQHPDDGRFAGTVWLVPDRRIERVVKAEEN